MPIAEQLPAGRIRYDGSAAFCPGILRVDVTSRGKPKPAPEVPTARLWDRSRTTEAGDSDAKKNQARRS